MAAFNLGRLLKRQVDAPGAVAAFERVVARRIWFLGKRDERAALAAHHPETLAAPHR